MNGRRLAAAALPAVFAVLLAASPAAAGGGDPVVPDVTEIELDAKKKNAGPHPILRWSEVEDATEYRVAVTSPKGKPYWTWVGQGVEVRLGGGPLDARDDSEGATLTKKRVWFVIAFGADGSIVGASAKRPIAP